MANEEHIAWLRKGVSAWNDWRRKNPKINPDLSGANLDGMYLECVNFENTNLEGANLSNCKLRWSTFKNASIDRITLSGADIAKTSLSSILEEQKIAQKRQEKLRWHSQISLQEYSQNISSQDFNPGSIGELSGFSKHYQDAIEESLRSFVGNGNDVACFGCYVYEFGHCEMCGHNRIKWHYILVNLQTKRQMIAGSECIQNYQIILTKWGYRPEYVVFPNSLRPYTKWIFEKNPYAIIFNDDVIRYSDGSCEDLISNMKDDSRLKHYRYVKVSHSRDHSEMISVDKSMQNNSGHLD